MYLVPKVMSTQHPDNATPAPFADDAGVLKGEGEVDEAVSVFEMGCDEQMWDSEGKEADSQVVRKLLTNYPDFFQNGHQLGRDMALTLRVPNPRIERDMRKSMVEALQSVPSSWDMARSFYGEGHAPPIQEVILPPHDFSRRSLHGGGLLSKGDRGPGRPDAARRPVSQRLGGRVSPEDRSCDTAHRGHGASARLRRDSRGVPAGQRPAAPASVPSPKATQRSPMA